MSAKTLLSWSSGKDAAWALHALRRDPDVEVVGLVAVLNVKYDRVSMHATRRALVEEQARAAGAPLETLYLPDPCTNGEYEAVMRRFVAGAVARGVRCMAFGDLFLEDVRGYRERQLRGTGLDPVFPLWGRRTDELAAEMLAAGVEAYVSSVDLKKLPADFAGERWSRDLIARFPAGCDPCGENGEIHTVVVDGPMFARRLPVARGEIVVRDGFAYADIVPQLGLARAEGGGL
ncbi:MAG: adenine nucleotide alpha hydrolase [Lentisphaerae bacterium]|nr:adenine nucleotide alpha hydrolase [Lentisphaerota bacterium]